MHNIYSKLTPNFEVGYSVIYFNNAQSSLKIISRGHYLRQEGKFLWHTLVIHYQKKLPTVAKENQDEPRI
jgi:hypothetical protein